MLSLTNSILPEKSLCQRLLFRGFHHRVLPLPKVLALTILVTGILLCLSYLPPGSSINCLTSELCRYLSLGLFVSALIDLSFWYLKKKKAANYFKQAQDKLLKINSANEIDSRKLLQEIVLLWEKAAKLGNLDALYTLAAHGSSILPKKGSAPDDAVAISKLKECIALGSPEAMHSLAYLYIKNSEVWKDLEESEKLLKKSLSIHENRLSQYLLFVCFKKQAVSKLKKENSNQPERAFYLKEAINWLQKAVKKPPKTGESLEEEQDRNNYKTCSYELALSYQRGECTAKNDFEAVRWFTKAANLNHGPSMSALALCLRDGLGVTKDDALALEWDKKAAELNEPQSICRLAIRYQKGDGVEKDERYGFQLLEKAGASSLISDEEPIDPDIQFELAQCYLKGVGVTKDPEFAVFYLGKAAKSGHLPSLHALAEIYKHGIDGDFQSERNYQYILERIQKTKKLQADASKERRAAFGVDS